MAGGLCDLGAIPIAEGTAILGTGLDLAACGTGEQEACGQTFLDLVAVNSFGLGSDVREGAGIAQDVTDLENSGERDTSAAGTHVTAPKKAPAPAEKQPPAKPGTSKGSGGSNTEPPPSPPVKSGGGDTQATPHAQPAAERLANRRQQRRTFQKLVRQGTLRPKTHERRRPQPATLQWNEGLGSSRYITVVRSLQ